MVVITGTVLYLLVVFPLGFVWHLLLFKRQFDKMGYLGRKFPIISLGVAAMAVQAVVTAILFDILRSQFPVATAAALAVGFLTLTIWSVQVFAHAAKFDVDVAAFVTLRDWLFRNPVRPSVCCLLVRFWCDFTLGSTRAPNLTKLCTEIETSTSPGIRERFSYWRQSGTKPHSLSLQSLLLRHGLVQSTLPV